MLKVGLVGAGGMGGLHLDLYESMEDIELAAVVDIDTEKAGSKLKNKNTRVYSSIDEMLEKEALDFVDVSTPSYLHKEHAVKAMKKGIHVICEKPIALYSKDAEEMAVVAKENGVFFMVAHVIRFWPEYALLKKYYEEKTFGKLYHAAFTRVGQKPTWSWENWMLQEEKSGRVIKDLHIHDADFILYLMGKPKAVIGHSNEEGEKISYISAAYEYENSFATAEGAWYDAPLPFSMSYRAVFERAIVEFKDGKLAIYEKDKEPKEVKIDNVLMENSGINISASGGYYNEIRYFAHCIKNNIPPSVITPEESVECLKVLESLRESIKKRQKITVK
jgi:predicted dehydrogenase